MSGAELNGIKVAKVTFELVQDGNTLGTTSDWEELKIVCEYQLPGEDPFFTIASDKGWSINGARELSAVIDILEKRVKEIEADLDDINIDEKVAARLITEAEENDKSKQS